MLLVNSAAANEEDTQYVEDIQPIAAPAEQVEDIMEERDESEASPADEDFPEVPGCEPLEGDREALPLADRAHRAISEALCEPADQLEQTLSDNDDNDENNDQSNGNNDLGLTPPRTGTTLLRISGSLDFNEDDGLQPGAGLSASVRLPTLYQQINLMVQRGSEAMRVDQFISDEPPPGLIWIATPTLFVLSHTDVGLRGWSPFVRVRIPWNQEWENGLSMRLRPEAYWRLDDGPGVGTEWRLTYPHDQDNRWTFNNRIEQNRASVGENEGATWSQQLSYRHRLADRFVVTGRLDHRGQTEPGWQTQSVRADVRLRRSLGRPWFNAELEPYTTWQRGQGFSPVPGVIARLEIQFGDYELYED